MKAIVCLPPYINEVTAWHKGSGPPLLYLSSNCSLCTSFFFSVSIPPASSIVSLNPCTFYYLHPIMDVTQIFYAPPLTSNTLESYQRARLVRSTRKLGAVLGTTPRLVEPEPIPIKLLPIGRSSTSSLSSNGHNSPYGYHHGYPRSYTSVKASPSINSVYSSSSSNSSVVSLTLPPTYSSDVLPTPARIAFRRRCLFNRERYVYPQT